MKLSHYIGTFTCVECRNEEEFNAIVSMLRDIGINVDGGYSDRVNCIGLSQSATEPEGWVMSTAYAEARGFTIIKAEAFVVNPNHPEHSVGIRMKKIQDYINKDVAVLCVDEEEYIGMLTLLNTAHSALNWTPTHCYISLREAPFPVITHNIVKDYGIAVCHASDFLPSTPAAQESVKFSLTPTQCPGSNPGGIKSIFTLPDMTNESHRILILSRLLDYYNTNGATLTQEEKKLALEIHASLLEFSSNLKFYPTHISDKGEDLLVFKTSPEPSIELFGKEVTEAECLEFFHNARRCINDTIRDKLNQLDKKIAAHIKQADQLKEEMDFEFKKLYDQLL